MRPRAKVYFARKVSTHHNALFATMARAKVKKKAKVHAEGDCEIQTTHDRGLGRNSHLRALQRGVYVFYYIYFTRAKRDSSSENRNHPPINGEVNTLPAHAFCTTVLCHQVWSGSITRHHFNRRTPCLNDTSVLISYRIQCRLRPSLPCRLRVWKFANSSRAVDR